MELENLLPWILARFAGELTQTGHLSSSQDLSQAGSGLTSWWLISSGLSK